MEGNESTIHSIKYIAKEKQINLNILSDLKKIAPEKDKIILIIL